MPELLLLGLLPQLSTVVRNSTGGRDFIFCHITLFGHKCINTVAGVGGALARRQVCVPCESGLGGCQELKRERKEALCVLQYLSVYVGFMDYYGVCSGVNDDM